MSELPCSGYQALVLLLLRTSATATITTTTHTSIGLWGKDVQNARLDGESRLLGENGSYGKRYTKILRHEMQQGDRETLPLSKRGRPKCHGTMCFSLELSYP